MSEPHMTKNPRDIALDLFMTAVHAADPYERVRETVIRREDAVEIAGVRYPRKQFTRVVVVGAGKASARMGEALEQTLGDLINAGWINTKDGHTVPLGRITVHEAGHPVPDQRGVDGAREIIGLLQSADEHTLVICLLSGGGSALLPAPADGITLEQKQGVTRLLMNAGADINELNAVRKHLSSLKGGGMARLAAPARLHALILSDVIGDRLDTIASGPTVADTTAFGDCIDILERYRLLDSAPGAVAERLRNGAAGNVPETVKPGDACLDTVTATIIGSSRMAVDAARRQAQECGYRTMVLTTTLDGEARYAGTMLASVASEIRCAGDPVKPPACLITGGETTVTVRGNGLGGRNQEMALAAATKIDGMEDVVFLSGGTDGTDGPTDAAGGIVDGCTAELGRKKRLGIESYLAGNDSYHYLEQVGGLIKTGPTGTNVMDIQIVLVGEPQT